MKKDNKPYNSVTAAKYLLALAISKRKILNVTKTQKLLYIAYGYFLSKKNRVLLGNVYVLQGHITFITNLSVDA